MRRFLKVEEMCWVTHQTAEHRYAVPSQAELRAMFSAPWQCTRPLRGSQKVFAFFSMDSIPFLLSVSSLFSLFFKINYLWLCIVDSFKYGLHTSCVLVMDVQRCRRYRLLLTNLGTERVASKTQKPTLNPNGRPISRMTWDFPGGSDGKESSQ